MVKPWITKFLDQFAQLANSYDHAPEYELVEALDPEGPVVADGSLKDLEFDDNQIEFKLEFRDRGDPRVIVLWKERPQDDWSKTVVRHPKAAFGLLYL